MSGERDFRLLWTGQAISQVGTQLSVVAIPVLAVESLGANEIQMGVLGACEFMAFLIVGLPAGAWVDRWHKRRVLITNDLARAVLYASIPIAWWLDVLTLAQLFIVTAAFGVCTVFFDVADQSYLPHLVAGERLVTANSRLQTTESVAQVAGPALAGGLLRVISAPVVVGLDAVSFAVSTLFVSRIHKVETPPQKYERRPLRTEVAEGLGFVLHHKLLRRIVATTSLSNLFGSMTAALFALYILRDLGMSTGVIGLVFSVSAVGGLLGAVISAPVSRFIGAGRTIALTALVMVPAGAFTPLAGLVDNPWRFVLLVSGGGLFFGLVVIYNITQVSYRQRVCPPALLGRMNASVRFIVWGSQPIGALLGGFLGAAFGVTTVLWITVVGYGISALPVVVSPLFNMRDFPDDPGTLATNVDG